MFTGDDIPCGGEYGFLIGAKRELDWKSAAEHSPQNTSVGSGASHEYTRRRETGSASQAWTLIVAGRYGVLLYHRLGAVVMCNFASFELGSRRLWSRTWRVGFKGLYMLA